MRTQDPFQFFTDLFSSIWNRLFLGATFNMMGFTVSYGSIIIVLIMISMVATVWWKGAHS